MSAPRDPSVVILKNSFYPTGLTEGDVWNYYQKYKGVILNQVRNRELMFVIMTDLNKPVIRRRTKDSKYIRLNNSNYDTVMTGRTLVVYSTMRAYEDIAIIDFDADKFNVARDNISLIRDVAEEYPEVLETTIRYTGKTSFHVICRLSRKFPINRIRATFETHFKSNEQIIQKGFTVAYRRKLGVPNIDLSPNKFRGAWITLNSLSLIGLMCIEVKDRELSTFNPNRARIK